MFKKGDWVRLIAINQTNAKGSALLVMSVHKAVSGKPLYFCASHENRTQDAYWAEELELIDGLDSYVTKPYHIEVRFDNSGDEPGWFARVIEWPGCMTQADSASEIVPAMLDAMRAWAYYKIQDGLPIPEPKED